MCKNLLWATGFSQRSKKLVISIRTVSKLNSEPAGDCIQPLATKIHIADKFEPKATQYVASKCLPLVKRSQPKKNNPTKVDSKKKASNASIANGAPKISPT